MTDLEIFRQRRAAIDAERHPARLARLHQEMAAWLDDLAETHRTLAFDAEDDLDRTARQLRDALMDDRL